MRITDSILVSINFDPVEDPDGAVLVIGRKKKKEAVEIYKKLVGDTKGSDD